MAFSDILKSSMEAGSKMIEDGELSGHKQEETSPSLHHLQVIV